MIGRRLGMFLTLIPMNVFRPNSLRFHQLTDKLVNCSVASAVLAHEMGFGLNLFDSISRAGSESNHTEQGQVREIIAHEASLVEA